MDDNEDELNKIFSIIINGTKRDFSDFDEPLEPSKNPPSSKWIKKKKHKKEDFYDYFKEAKELTIIDKKIENLKDLIELGETYNKDDEKRYVINLKALHKCIGSLKELDNFIGMSNIKEMILDLIFLRLQNFEDNNNNEMWHLVVQGSPGCGKTEVSKVLGKLYYGLGIVEKDTFVQVKRSQLIGKWCGHTAAQTQAIFDENEGGVIFIDEAYSLGNTEQRDSFTKECIDTINLNLTEKKKTVVIIAGYKEQLESSFFSYNPGLARRFKMRLSVDNYNHIELRQIYLKKLYENEWSVMNDNEEQEIPIVFLKKIKIFLNLMEEIWKIYGH